MNRDIKINENSIEIFENRKRLFCIRLPNSSVVNGNHEV